MSISYDDMNFTSPYLRTTKCPTFIIHGDRDPLFPIEIPVDFYKSIPNSYLWIVPNNGHIPAGVYDRKSIWTEGLYDSIHEFLNGEWE